jgi:hypothetical protein
MRFRIASAVLSLLLACPALAGVRTSHDETADFSKYETWAWAPSALGVGNEGALAEAGNRRLVPQAIALELLDKGLVRTNAEDADLLVHYEVSVLRRQSVSDDPLHRMEAEYNYKIGLKGDRWVQSYKDGRCIVDLIDREDERLVWKGWVTGRVDIGYRSERQIYSAVRRLFADYPPKTEAASEEAADSEKK